MFTVVRTSHNCLTMSEVSIWCAGDIRWRWCHHADECTPSGLGGRDSWGLAPSLALPRPKWWSGPGSLPPDSLYWRTTTFWTTRYIASTREATSALSPSLDSRSVLEHGSVVGGWRLYEQLLSIIESTRYIA